MKTGPDDRGQQQVGDGAGRPIPSTSEQPMIASRASNRLSPASGMIAAGTPVPIPVRETRPITMPTQAAAATSGTPRRPPWS